ncbi:hypothetical protein RN001_015869 [Aquatica leii]|uniref:Uncharacterized protein n=1 Tax=Aquatica leii TaxID=1421715 RepID=A0AAN7PXT8_9COLE|nr:hypothetical protein RN001_015869 [Aquatica leii]
MEYTPHWKRIWMTVNGRRDHIGSIGASTAINHVKNDLITGVAIYKPYSDNSYKLCLEKLGYLNDVETQKKVQQISISMNLDVCTTWAMLCNYLKFECYIDIENINDIVKYLNNNQKCNIDMWQFYTLERMFLLKILYSIIENCENKNHRFYDLYKKFIKEVSLKKIQESLFKQFSLLSKEINLENRDNCLDITNWVERNKREQLQILFIILTTLAHEKCDVDGFIQMLKSFKEPNSVFKVYHWDKPPIGKTSTLQGIRNVEIAIVLSSLEDFWHNSEIWYSRFKEIDSEIVEICKNWNSPVLLLAWVALHLTVPFEIATLNYESQLQSYLRNALHANAFSDLHEVVSNVSFKNSLAGLAVKMAIFTILEVLCIKLGATTIYDHEGTVTLLGKLLQVPEIAVVWHEGSDEGAKSFYNIAVSLFPLHFHPFSICVKSLITLKCDTESVIHGLNNLQLYTEKYDKPVIHMVNKEFLLNESYRPLKNDLVVFEKGTRMTFENRNKLNVVRFHGSYSYFKVLLHIVDTLLAQLQEHNVSELIATGVEAGYNIILETLKIQPSLIANNPDVKQLLKSSFYLLHAVSKPRVTNINLVILCFEVIVYQFEINSDEVLKHLGSIKFLPVLQKNPYAIEDFCNLNILSSAIINECTSDLFSLTSCDLLYLYIKLVKKAIKAKLFVKEIILPGLIFLIAKVFPKFSTQFTGENDKTRKICCKLISLCHLVLRQNRSTLNEAELLYVDSVITLFAQKKLYTATLVSIFRIRNVQLELILSVETNYSTGPLLKLVKSVKRALQCIAYILNFMCLNNHTNDLFEEYLWQFSPNGSILSHIAEYKSHSFDNEIPQVAWDVLTNFALISRKPLLQAFRVGSREIRQWIMQSLRDPLLTDNIKISIINFIKACIYEQASMIVAFFNIEDYQLEPKIEESVAEFMAEYLSNMSKDVTILSQPLQLAVLELFHVLWKTNKKHVIKRIMGEESFWKLMSTPLLKPERLPLDATILSFEIFILELCSTKGELHANYTSAIANIFDSSNNFIELWVNRAVAITEIDNLNVSKPGHFSLAIVLVTVLKKFLLVVQRFYPKYEGSWNTYVLKKKCLETLLYCSRHSENTQLITWWAEFNLLFCTPKAKNDTEILETLECLSNILLGYLELYKIMDDKDRLTILTLTYTILNNSVKVISENRSLIERFLRSVITLFCFEYGVTFLEDKKEERKHEQFYYRWILILKIINVFLKIESIKDFEHFFVSYLYLDKVFEVLYFFIKNKWPVRVAEVTLSTLICYADSKMDYHFDLYFKNIIYRMISPDMYKLDINTLKWGVIPVEVKNHWMLYTHIIRLNQILLHRRGSFVMEPLLLFIERHQKIISNAILSITMVLTNTNLQLVCHILHFVHDLVKIFRQWPTINSFLFEPIMSSINEVLNVGSHILVIPNIIMFTLESDTYKKMPHSEVPEINFINMINSYLEIITWSCMCLNQANPPFYNLLDYYQDTNFQIRVKYEFRFPPLSAMDRKHLSFNVLLSILHFLCNTLTRIANDSKIDGRGKLAVEKPELKDYIALIYPWDKKDDINTLVMMSDDATNESSSQIHWLVQLNVDLLLQTLSALNTFLATQIFLATRDNSLRYDEIYYMRRQLCSDLLYFYKFVNNHVTNATFSKLHKERTSGVAAQSKKGLCLFVDVSKVCCDEEGQMIPVTSTDDGYFLVLTHWFKHVCQLVYSSKFDEMLSQLNVRTMRIVYNQMYAEN